MWHLYICVFYIYTYFFNYLFIYFYHTVYKSQLVCVGGQALIFNINSDTTTSATLLVASSGVSFSSTSDLAPQKLTLGIILESGRWYLDKNYLTQLLKVRKYMIWTCTQLVYDLYAGPLHLCWLLMRNPPASSHSSYLRWLLGCHLPSYFIGVVDQKHLGNRTFAADQQGVIRNSLSMIKSQAGVNGQ